MARRLYVFIHLMALIYVLVNGLQNIFISSLSILCSVWDFKCCEFSIDKMINVLIYELMCYKICHVSFVFDSVKYTYIKYILHNFVNMHISIYYIYKYSF